MPEHRIVREAAAWMARLWAEDADDEDRRRCAQWRAAHPEHERAWQALQGVDARIGSLPRELAGQVLREPAGGRQRRGLLRLIGAGIVFGGAAQILRQSEVWQDLAADLSTATGEIRETALDDGGTLTLASATRVDLRRPGGSRELLLRSGEIMLQAPPGAEPQSGRWRIRGRDGVIEADAARLALRQNARHSQLTVFAGRAALHAADGAIVRLAAGQRCRFDAAGAASPEPAPQGADSWAQGLLLAEDMPLAELVAELARYRPGVLRCDPAVAALRVSGVFPLRDTERALRNLSLALPVTPVYRSRYWVTLRPA